MKAIADAYDSLPPFSMHIDSENWNGDRLREIFSVELYRDRRRIDLIWTRYDVRNDESKPAYKKRGVWTGNQYQYRQQFQGLATPPNPDPLQAYVSSKKQRAIQAINSHAAAPYLRGVFPGDSAGIATMLAQASALSVNEDMEEVGGHACYVIEASTKWGEVKLWVDPLFGFNIRRALIVKGEGDLNDGEPLPRRRWASGSDQQQVVSRVTDELKEVVIEKIGDHFVSVAGQFWHTETGDDGRQRRTHSSAKVSEFVWKPDFKKMDAFVMDEIPEGSRVWPMDAEDRDVDYLWRSGKAVPVRQPTPTPQRRPIS